MKVICQRERGNEWKKDPPTYRERGRVIEIDRGKELQRNIEVER